MIRLTQNDWRIFHRLQRKHKVSTEFLRYNLENIEKFIWFETWPRIVIRRYAIRKGNRVFIIYYRLRRVLFDQANSKIFKRMRQNIKQWSKRAVAWQKNHFGVKEYIEEVVYEDKSKEIQEVVTANEETTLNSNEDVSKQMKEQLEILKSGRRPQSLIANAEQNDTTLCIEKGSQLADDETSCNSHEENHKSDSNNVDEVSRAQGNTDALYETRQQSSDTAEKPGAWQINLESTPEKQITTQENIQPIKQLDTDEKTEKSHTEETSTQQTEKLKSGLNFLDMLMCKVSGSTPNNAKVIHKANETLQRMPSLSSPKDGCQYHHEHSMDSTDEFLGFEDCERIPGMLMTPIVPNSTKNSKNSVFVSESLNEYMRLNDLETNYSIDEDKTVTKGKIFARDMEGLMTLKTTPPRFDMPAVPENLLKFRTVAERKQYLQKCSRNYRLAIINNEASIYRELQRRMRTQKVKSASQMLAQSANSSMSFTRNGWKAASFINTEFNNYYYQILDVDHGTYKVRLRGARGNNNEFYKTPYVSRIIKQTTECFEYCPDDKVWQYLKPIKTIEEKNKKLNRDSLPSVFKPCPLSHKTFQKPLDDDTAALLLAGGSMAVVRMPTVELEVFPECGKPLHEIAKRYLQYILPHHDISREWAEFSVSTLQQPQTLKEAEQAAAKSFTSHDTRKSYTFVIPYLNDRNHILVRRVVDRSEKLDESFEHCVEEKELVPKTDFSFRKNLDLTDEVLQTCADVVSDMINTVAISCSENSFIKTDPDGLHVDCLSKSKMLANTKLDGLERPAAASSPNNAVLCGGNSKKPKKQNSLLMELKRLNATIIDAAVKPADDNKPCCREYCRMGCICISLKEKVPMRQHCGKPKCMLECTCKPSSNQSRIMRLETDGRTLTTEDAFMLRRKATARLARIEKEFTSTVVLTENETLLINETNNDKKRRCTKAPKRYEDFTDTEDEQRKNSPKKTAMTTIDKEKHLAYEIKEVHDPVYVQDSIMDQLKHCTVNIVPLPDMDNVATWCMVHNLYKCFCKGRATEGKPIIIEKEEANTTTAHSSEQKLEFDYAVSGKAKYTFEKVEKEKSAVTNEYEESNYNAADDDEEEDLDENDDDDDDDNDDDEDNDDDWAKKRKRKRKEGRDKRSGNKIEATKTVEEFEETGDNDNSEEYSVYPEQPEIQQKMKRNLHDVRIRFFLPRPEGCRRHIPTPRRMFLYCNRKRRLNVLRYIKENENDRTRLLLNEHVMRSVYYHKHDIENRKKMSASSVLNKDKEKATAPVSQPPQAEAQPTPDVTKRKFLLVNEVVDLLEDDDDTIMSNNSSKTKDGNGQQQSSSNRETSNEFEKISPDTESNDSQNHFQICSSGGVITVKKYTTNADLHNKEVVPKTASPAMMVSKLQQSTIEVRQSEAPTEPTCMDELKLPKIASCFSLNVKANVPKSSPSMALNDDQCLDFSSATSFNSTAFSQNKNPPHQNSTRPLSTENAAAKDPTTSAPLDMNNETVRDVYNSVIKTMNSLVSKKMQDIDCALQRESHIIPTPNADILCIMKWGNFLDAFCEGFAYIWQVKMKNSSFFAITIQNIMPMIIGAMGIVNITALKAEKLPLMGKMLLQRFRSADTETLAVVMQGKQSHWVVKGFLKSDPSMACNKPTPESHPSLTKKINILCSLLVKQRQKDQKKKDRFINNSASSSVQNATQTFAAPNSAPAQLVTTTSTPAQVTQTPSAPKVAQILPTRRIVTIQPLGNPRTPVQQLQQPAAQQIDAHAVQKSSNQNESDADKVVAKVNSRKRKVDDEQSNNLMKMDRYIKMSSNIEFRSVTQSDVDEIFLPEIQKIDHKWLVLDLHNDFSHIFVPEFRDLVSLDRIQKVINFARQKSKIVKLQFFQNAPFDAFVTPRSARKIYFGPLTMNMKGPTLILLQSVDGQMMLRELYQLQHNIAKKPEERTKAFWLVHVKGQTHFEMDVRLIQGTAAAQKAPTNVAAATSTAQALNKIGQEDADVVGKSFEHKQVNNEEDEDCFIIDDEPEIYAGKDNAANLLPQINSLMIAPMQSIQSSPLSTLNAAEAQVFSTTPHSLLKTSNTSCTNSAAPVLINMPSLPATSKPLSILTLPPNTIITGISPSSTPIPKITTLTNVTPTQIFNIPKTAIITGVEAAPAQAPYSSTIFVQSAATSSTVAVATTSTSTTSAAAATSTKSLGMIRVQSNEATAAGLKQPMKTIRQALEAGPIKRRRISLFCSNKFDKASEKLAVDAVIRNFLPENAEDIQISEANEAAKLPTTTVSEVVATVGSTKISKIPSTKEKNLSETTSSEFLINKEITARTTKAATATATTTTTKSKAPIVFDVNFMDDGDEPTASIVIKPTSTAAKGSTSTTTITHTSGSIATKTTAATNSAMRAPLPTNTVYVSASQSVSLPTGLSCTAPPNKKIKLPTVSNSLPAVTLAGGSVTVTAPGKLINSLLCTKQARVVPKFSLPRPIAPKLTPASTTITTPSGDQTTTATPFPFRRASVSLKVQKISCPTMTAALQQTMKPLTAASVAANQAVSTSTLTVKQVQDMLKKSSQNVAAAANSPHTSASPAVSTSALTVKQVQEMFNKSSGNAGGAAAINSSPASSSPAAMPMQILPSIKATIASVNATAVTATTIAAATPAAIMPTNITLPTDCVITTTTTPTPIVSAVSVAPASSTTSSNSSTLTISKVQSFGLPQKPHKPDNPPQTIITPPAPQTAAAVSGDLQEDKVLTPNPPPHIQYGYIVSAAHDNHKFVAKRVAEEFYVKVPSVGILKLQGLAAVHNYLNKYMSKTLKETTPAAVWQFVAASKAVQIQNHQKSLLVRKTKNTNGKSETSKNANINPNNSLNEPILIDD